MITEKIIEMEKLFRSQEWSLYREHPTELNEFDNGYKFIFFEFLEKSNYKNAQFKIDKEEYKEWRKILENFQKEKRVMINNKTKFQLKQDDVIIGNQKEGKYKGYTLILINPEIIDKLNKLEINLE